MDVIVLAAGSGSRFGGNKLLAPVDGIPMFEHTIRRIRDIEFEHKIVVTRYREIVCALNGSGIQPIENREPELGISRSISLGLAALPGDSESCMFLVCDQPWLSEDTITGLIRKYRESGKGIGAAASCGEAGNPVIFSKKYYAELAALTGDRGGKRVLTAHPEDVVLYETDGRELRDVDTKL